MSDWIVEVAKAYRWHRALGNEVVEGSHCQFIKDVEHPDVWSSNHITNVRAASETEIRTLFAEMELELAHCSHRFVSADCFTPQQFLAYLSMSDYRELSPTLQMVLSGELENVARSEADLRPVESEDDWESVYQMVRTDHEEGARTNRTIVSEAVSRGIVDGFKRKRGPSTLYLASLDGEPCAYGMAVACPNGIGMVEDLYTLPSARNRGIASEIIRHCVFGLRENGREIIFLGAHVGERPKYLYRKLGFVPLMVTREYVLEKIID